MVRAAEAGHLSATLGSLRADWARSHQSRWALNLIKPNPTYQAFECLSEGAMSRIQDNQRYQVDPIASLPEQNNILLN